MLVTLEREFSNENIARPRNNLENVMWGEVCKVNDTTIDRNNVFRDIFQYHANSVRPQIKSKILLNNKNKWITFGIRKSAKKLKQLRKDDANYKNKENALTEVLFELAKDNITIPKSTVLQLKVKPCGPLLKNKREIPAETGAGTDSS